jgi:hypothetical protein
MAEELNYWTNTTYAGSFHYNKVVSYIEPFEIDKKWLENEELGKKKLKPYTFLNKKERKLKIFRKSIFKKKPKIQKKVIK